MGYIAIKQNVNKNFFKVFKSSSNTGPKFIDHLTNEYQLVTNLESSKTIICRTICADFYAAQMDIRNSAQNIQLYIIVHKTYCYHLGIKRSLTMKTHISGTFRRPDKQLFTE